MKIRHIERLSDGSLPTVVWPGGYPMYYVGKEVYLEPYGTEYFIVCPDCANSAIRKKDSELVLVEGEINWENPSLCCDLCNRRIPSAYADEDIDE